MELGLCSTQEGQGWNSVTWEVTLDLSACCSKEHPELFCNVANPKMVLVSNQHFWLSGGLQDPWGYQLAESLGVGAVVTGGGVESP